MNRPQPNEYPTWGKAYISKIDRDIFEILKMEPILSKSKLIIKKYKIDWIILMEQI